MLTKQRRDGPGKTEGGRRWARNNEEFPSKLRSSIRLKRNSRPPRGKEGPLKLRGLLAESWNFPVQSCVDEGPGDGGVAPRDFSKDSGPPPLTAWLCVTGFCP